MEELIKLLTNQIGAVAVCLIFIWYLAKVIMPHIAQKNKDMNEALERFNCTIENQLVQANQVIKENTAAQVKTNDAIQRLSECINRINRKTSK